MTGVPTNPRFKWPEYVREAQREAAAAVDKLVRAETRAEVEWEEQQAEVGGWTLAYQDKPGTILDDLDESYLSGFVVFGQYQFMTGDAEDSLQMSGSSGTMTKATRLGLIRAMARHYGQTDG